MVARRHVAPSAREETNPFMRFRALIVVTLLAATLLAVPRGPQPANAQGTVVVATAGDIARRGSPGTPQKQTARLITDTINPDRVLELGDAQYEHGEYTQFMNSYDPTWGAFKDITAPILGNHEYETAKADGYFRYFANQLSAYGSSARDPGAGNYSFDIGDWHVVALNSNCKFVSCSGQIAFLKKDVAADGHLCEIVMFHNASQSSLVKAAASVNVDLALAGHKHKYERWDRPSGANIRLLVVGTGGRSLGDPDPDADAGVKAYGVVRLDLSPTSYAWKFIDVGGRVRDSGSSNCRD